jgi:soluble lytic murein transglycosylase
MDWRRAAACSGVLFLIGLIASGVVRQIALADQAAPTSLALGAASDRPPPEDYARLRDGMAAAASGDWATVRTLRAASSDPLVRRILQWRVAAGDGPAAFNELSQALRELEDWPGRATMRQRAERAILDAGLSASERVSWLSSESGPVTGDGRIALAQALKQTGRTTEAEALARAAWRSAALSPRAEQIALSDFSGTLTSEDHAHRLDAALWRGDRGLALRLMPRVSAADRLVAQARIALQTRPRRGLQRAVDAAPASRHDDPGFLFDRARFHRRSGRAQEAMAYVKRISAPDAPEVAREAIFRENSCATRRSPCGISCISTPMSRRL